MRLIITGANSLLGMAAIRALCGSHEIRAVDQQIESELPAGVEKVCGDIRDREFAGSVTENVDAVLHLAPLDLEGMDEPTVIDTFSRGSFNLVDMAIEQGVTRFLLASSLSLFSRFPTQWRVDESWRPRPEPVPSHLACWLSELSLRECCHTAPIRAICLRFAEIVDFTPPDRRSVQPDCVHVEDAVQAIQCGLRQLEEQTARGEWEIYQITGGDEAVIRGQRARGEKFGYQPSYPSVRTPLAGEPMPVAPSRWWRAYFKRTPTAARSVEASNAGVPRREKQQVVIFGSGGPVAASLASELKEDFILRQTDVRPLAEIRTDNRPQSEGAPLPTILPSPHEERTVDVRDYSQVDAACEGMDVAVNCTVVRPDHVEAFRVNTLGAYNVAKAAVSHGIRRLVQTGPQLMIIDEHTGYWWDFDVPGNAPARPGRNLYAHSKFLGQAIVRVFAEYYELDVPVLVYAQFLNPQVAKSVWSMAVSWEDSARALRRAIEVDTLPSPYEEIVITSDLPHGKFSARRALEVLGWEAQDDLSGLWVKQ